MNQLARFFLGIVAALGCLALPLWYQWQRWQSADAAALSLAGQMHDLELRQAAEATRHQSALAKTLATAPRSLDPDSFLALEEMCSSLWWTTLMPFLEKRVQQFPDAGDDLSTLLLTRWATQDPSAAWAWWSGLGRNDILHAQETKSLCATWAWQDPEGFLHSFADPASRAKIIYRNLDGVDWLGRKDLLLAAEALKLADPYWLQHTKFLAPHIHSSQQARSLVRKILADRGDEFNDVSPVILAWAEVDEAAAMREVQNNPGFKKDEQANLQYAWSKQRFLQLPQTVESADMWLAQTGDWLQSDARKEIVNVLAMKDVNKAGRWLQQQDPTESALARLAFAERIAPTDMAAAIAWVDSIPDLRLRDRGIEDIFRTPDLEGFPVFANPIPI